MNRRIALKNLMIASGGLLALPAWAKEWRVADLSQYPSSFSFTEQRMFAAVADTIIPGGNSIGALSVGVDKFLIRLIDDCYEKEVQANVKKQFTALETAAQNTYSKPFTACDQLQRQDLLQKLSISPDKAQKDFFNLMKGETIRGFNTSKEVMVTYFKYQVAPGHYYGCVNVKA